MKEGTEVTHLDSTSLRVDNVFISFELTVEIVKILLVRFTIRILGFSTNILSK